MSNKLMLKQSLIFTAFFSFGFASTYLFHQYQSSSMPSKAPLTASKVLFNTKLGKQLAFVNVQLEFKEHARKNTDVTEIKAYVTLLKSTSNAFSYKWDLPEGVQLVEGTAEGELVNISVESPQEITLKVAGFSKQDKKLISLTAHTLINDNVFSNVGLISSRPEDSYEFIANQNFKEGESQQIDLSSQAAPVAPRDEKIQR